MCSRSATRSSRHGPGGLVSRLAEFRTRSVVSSAGEGRLLVLTAPGGLEGFFRQLAAAEEAGTLGPDAYAAASEAYGITCGRVKMEPAGLEPATFWLPSRRSPS